METDEESFAKEVGVEVTVGGSKVEAEFNWSVLEQEDTLLPSCEITFIMYNIMTTRRNIC